MALDPEIAALLQLVNGTERPKPDAAKMDETRALFEQGCAVLAPPDLPANASQDLIIPGPGGDLPARLTRPADGSGDGSGLLIYFHGGGFSIGSVASHDPLTRQLANASGASVLSVDYRLAPEHPFPAPLEDAIAATRWAGDNAAKLNIDASRMAVGGDSAGANLCAVTAITLRDEGGPKLRLQMLLYPVVEMDAETGSMEAFAEGYYLERETIHWFTKQYVPAGVDKKEPRVSPLFAASHADLPPTYLVTAGHDPLRDEGAAYALKLKAAGVPTTYIDYPGQIHGFFNMVGASREAGLAVDAAGAALKQALA